MESLISILVAACAASAVGALWYSPMLFGPAWQRLTGVDFNNASHIKRTMVVGFIVTLLMAYVLSFVFMRMAVDGLWQGGQVAGWLWLGFTAVYAINTGAYEHRPFALTAMTSGYHLVALLVMAIVFAFL